MDTTKDFDNFPEGVKNCQMEETIEECANRKLLRGAAKKCKCLPGLVNQLQKFLEVEKIFFLFF